MRHMALLAALLFAPLPCMNAQVVTQLPTGHGGSAHVRASWEIGGAHISIEYGRPSLKRRPEAKMMPIGAPWRTGADAATVLTTDRTLTFGEVVLPPGSYTINTQPAETRFEMMFGTLEKPGQWGIPYRPDLELGRIVMIRSHTALPVEQVTFSIDRSAAGGTLRLEWGTVRVSAPFTIAK